MLKFAIGLEAVLSRGLLAMAQGTRNRSPEYRYMMHEVVEEGRHSMMFQELINRLDADPQPTRGLDRFFDDRIAMTGRSFPELFFFAVLGGEIYIDQQNRELLRRPTAEVHPLFRRVMQIHVTEEARHVCFAERYLEHRLPELGPGKRALLRAVVPMLLSEPARMMLIPPRKLVARYQIPRAAMRQAFGPGTPHRQTIARTVDPSAPCAKPTTCGGQVAGGCSASRADWRASSTPAPRRAQAPTRERFTRLSGLADHAVHVFVSDEQVGMAVVIEAERPAAGVPDRARIEAVAARERGSQRRCLQASGTFYADCTLDEFSVFDWRAGRWTFNGRETRIADVTRRVPPPSPGGYP